MLWMRLDQTVTKQPLSTGSGLNCKGKMRLLCYISTVPDKIGKYFSAVMVSFPQNMRSQFVAMCLCETACSERADFYLADMMRKMGVL